jgi:hypothetical protein
MSTESMPIPVKKSPRRDDAFVTFVKLIVACFTGNVYFTNTTPTIASIDAQADKLAVANGLARGKGPGLVADRDAKRKNLEEDLDHLLDYVRATIKASGADAATAITMILSTGFSVRKTARPPKAPLAARYGRVSGEVLLVALAVAHSAMYFWELSSDLKVWSSIPETMRANTTVSGLTAGQVYYFRFRAHTRKGVGDYSNVVKLLVH